MSLGKTPDGFADHGLLILQLRLDLNGTNSHEGNSENPEHGLLDWMTGTLTILLFLLPLILQLLEPLLITKKNESWIY